MGAPKRPAVLAAFMNSAGADWAGMVVCSLIWGTTWYAITLQLGVVSPIASVTYRFALAGLLFLGAIALLRGRVGMSPAQHFNAAAQGLLVVSIDYALVYLAEERVVSAVVALVFSGLAFFNLVVFRLFLGQRASASVWGAALLGIAGVGILSAGEIFGAKFDRRAIEGVVMTLGGALFAALGQIFAYRQEKANVPVAVATGWAMGYGAFFLVIYGFATGLEWGFDPRPPYVLALIYLAVFGSVVAFWIYFGLARRRGYATASYISALTPPIAMGMSTVFEGRAWGLSAFGGIALILCGQILMVRAKKPSFVQE